MENIVNMRHIQLPNGMLEKVKPKDLLVYLTIKRYMNYVTKCSFPSLTTIASKTEMAINTVRSCINILVDNEYMFIVKKQNKNVYKFPPYFNFEPFSYEFLDNPELTFREKEYIIASQQFMFKDVKGEGRIAFTDKELSNKINMSRRSIYNADHSLKEKNLLEIKRAKDIDYYMGPSSRVKIFHLDKIKQNIIWDLRNSDELKENKSDSIIVGNKIMVSKEINNILKENKFLKNLIECEL